MNTALITGSCGLVGSESSIFFQKKDLRLLASTIMPENLFSVEMEI